MHAAEVRVPLITAITSLPVPLSLDSASEPPSSLESEDPGVLFVACKDAGLRPECHSALARGAPTFARGPSRMRSLRALCGSVGL